MAHDHTLITARPKGFAAIRRFVKLMFKAFGEDDTFDLGAALAYYTIFSIIPLLVVIIAISGLVAGPEAVSGELFRQLNGLVGTETADALQDMLGDAYISGKGLVATVVGVITLVIGATGIFNSLQTALNRIWEIQPRPKSSILAFLIKRLLSFSFVMGLGFLLMVTFVVNSLITGFGDDLAKALPGAGGILVVALSWALMVAISTLVFACMFKFLPDAHLAWKDALPGAIFTTVLFLLGKTALDFYFDAADPTSTFGAAAGLISLLLWTFYASQIFFLGAEFVWVWCAEHGRPILPKDDAVRVVRQEMVVEKGELMPNDDKRTGVEEVRAEEADRR